MGNKLLVLLLGFVLSSGVFASDESKYDDIITQAAAEHNVDAALIKAVIKQESGFNPTAGSNTKYGDCSGGADPATCGGAYGLMQLMPGTAQDLGLSPADRGDPGKNIFAGTKYLAQLLNTFNGDYVKAIAAYNAGSGNVTKYNGVPPFNETINYVHNVVANYQAYGGTAPIATGSIPPTDSGTPGSPPSTPGGSGTQVGNPSIITLADGEQVLSDFESYIGLPSGALENVFKGLIVALLMAFAGLQLIYFFGMPLSGGTLAGANDSTRLVTPFYLSLRTLLLVGFLSFFILN